MFSFGWTSSPHFFVARLWVCLYPALLESRPSDTVVLKIEGRVKFRCVASCVDIFIVEIIDGDNCKIRQTRVHEFQCSEENIHCAILQVFFAVVFLEKVVHKIFCAVSAVFLISIHRKEL